MKKLKTILQYNKTYYFLLLIVLIYIIIYHSFYKCDHIYNINESNFSIKITNYKIDGNKLKINTSNLICFYYFKSYKEKLNFYKNYSIGDTIKVNGSLSVPNNNTIPNTFNYKEYLYHNNIEYILNIDSFIKEKNNKNIFYKVKNTIYKRVNNIPNNEYLYAFILGDSSNIDSDLYDSFRINGITHLFAISALHISLFSSFLFKILRKIRINYNTSLLLVSLFLLFYSFIVSFTPSVLRAFIFFLFNKSFKIFNIYTKNINKLYLTIIILLIINPNYIFNKGFLLSVCISLFFLLCSGSLSKIKTNLMAFLSSTPIIINMSYEINVLSIINNLLFIPLISNIIFPFTLICIFIPKLTIVLKLFTNILEFLSVTCNKISNISLIISKMSLVEIIIYYILLIASIKNKKHFKFLVLYIFLLYLIPTFISQNGIYFLDVKQGDSTLIIYNKTTTLIDTGGIVKRNEEEWEKKNNNYDMMNSSIIPFFKSLGIKRIDNLILTHGDYDHMGETINLVNNFKVEKVIFNCGSYNDLEKELIKVLDKKKIKYYSCIKELNIDNNKLYFLQTKDYDNENDNSNVIYTELNGYKFMFMGDASITTEKEILGKYDLPDIDVLKVGHHGSKTSSSKEFINEINPKYSIISVGKDNKFGHPNKETLDNLINTKIYRTDQDGSIMFKIKNNKLRVETFSP